MSSTRAIYAKRHHNLVSKKMIECLKCGTPTKNTDGLCNEHKED